MCIRDSTCSMSISFFALFSAVSGSIVIFLNRSTVSLSTLKSSAPRNTHLYYGIYVSFSRYTADMAVLTNSPQDRYAA